MRTHLWLLLLIPIVVVVAAPSRGDAARVLGLSSIKNDLFKRAVDPEAPGPAGPGATPTPTRTSTRTPTPTVTPAPAGPVSFALGLDVDRDGTNDCGTGVPAAAGDGAPDAVPVEVNNTACSAAPGAQLDANVYLLDSFGVVYDAQASSLKFSGLSSKGRGDAAWAGCFFEVTILAEGFENVACAIAIDSPTGRTDLGLMTVFPLTCASSGSVRLEHGASDTVLVGASGGNYVDSSPDVLTVSCSGQASPTITPPPVATNTPTITPTGTIPSATPTIGVTPTMTPTGTIPTATPTIVVTPTMTPTGTIPTATPTLAVTPTMTPTGTVAPLTSTGTPVSATPTHPSTGTAPTNTPTRTKTPTRTPAQARGDVTCDGRVGALDALAILQLSAGLIQNLPCENAGDVNRDGRIGVLDAQLILQHDAGIIDQL